MDVRSATTDVALDQAYAAVVRIALAEDVAGRDRSADVTTTAVVPADARLEAEIVVKAGGVLCGVDGVRAAFEAVDPSVAVRAVAADADEVTEGQVVVRVDGTARSILTAERTALNLLGHLSGVATLTRRLVALAAPAAVLDTRKTLPGLRTLQKYAVRCGGGVNHRFGLSDGVLVKDNHIVVAGSVREAVRRAATAGMPVQCEVESEQDVRDALGAGADSLLLDNATPERIAQLVAVARSIRRDVVLEASGGITPATIPAVAATGVDRISVGALTHSAPASDVGLTVTRVL